MKRALSTSLIVDEVEINRSKQNQTGVDEEETCVERSSYFVVRVVVQLKYVDKLKCDAM